MRLKIIKGDITTVECDAIVNPTNPDFKSSDTINTSIFEVAGEKLNDFCINCSKIDVGKCVVTPGFNLQCRYIVHTAVPYVYEDSSAHLLANCYKNAINRAISKGWSSIAFPLIGLGEWGFTVKKALNVAVNRIEVCIREEPSDLIIFFVLPDESIKKSAIEQIKKILSEKYWSIEEYEEGVPIMQSDNRWISLCRVNRPDKKQDIWMQRLADSVNGKLIAPVFDDDKEKIFENRPLIFHQDGPDIPDSIGFWEWTEVQMEQGRWYTDANYIEDTVPVEIIMHNNALNLEELIDELREGITIPSYIRSHLMLAIRVNGHVEGVLCDFENFVVSIGNDTLIRIKEGVYSLPCYILEESDIFTWRNRKIYKHISLGEPQRQVSVFVIGEAIKQMLLQRMSWPVFKAQGISKNDWSKIKQFIAAIAKDTIPEKLSKIYNISTQDALRYIDAFMQRVAEYVDAEDVDSAIIVQILENHGKLRESCNEKAYERWLIEHKEEIDNAQLEVSEVYNQAKERLSAIEASLLESQKALEAAEEKREKALTDVLTAERKLGELTLKIEKYEVLEQAAISAVRNKIADAQKDMARFIADISIFMPQQVTTANDQRGTRWSYTGAVQDAYPEHEIELAESWEDEVSTISQNLLSSLDVPREMCSMLAAFLYSAHINNTPLIITGPGGGEISKLMAISLYAEDAGRLVLGNGYDENIAASLNDVKEHIIMIKNMFGEGWSDELPQDFTKSKKHIIWTRPYVDDMTIEPKSLYNYMIPVISEYIVGSLADFEPWPGKRADKFKHLASEKTTPLRLAGFKKLGLGRMFILQLERVLSDAKTIIASTAKDKDLELLFGLLPLCVVCGRTDIIKDAIENDNGISSFAKAEAKRFIEDE